MKAIQKTLLGLCLGSIFLSVPVFASEFDQYLQEKKILDAEFKIIDQNALNELLAVLSAEDSKTLPIQVDSNTLIEELQLYHDHTRLKGRITTPDFSQFEKTLSGEEVQKIVWDGLLKNCNILFEHEYQRTNPYKVQLALTSETNQYDVDISQQECQ
jgi:hypothetical protein